MTAPGDEAEFIVLFARHRGEPRCSRLPLSLDR
jgi:hypothetical protein